jgi:hypothetical protein
MVGVGAGAALRHCMHSCVVVCPDEGGYFPKRSDWAEERMSLHSECAASSIESCNL